MSPSSTARLELTAGTECVLGIVDFTALDLFMFSAAGWHPHRIHFDLPYAQAEGHSTLVVHGPLQAVHLFQALASALPAHARVVRTTYRHKAGLYLGTPATMHAAVADVDCGTATVNVWFADDNGTTTTSGVAVIEIRTGATPWSAR